MVPARENRSKWALALIENFQRVCGKFGSIWRLAFQGRRFRLEQGENDRKLTLNKIPI